MLIDGKPFPGSTSYVDKHTNLLSVAGTAFWFTEFVPIHFRTMRSFHKLLFHFYRHGLCCFITGSFVLYVEGFLTFFRGVTIYMVLDDHHPIERLIFKMVPHVIQNFIIGSFILNIYRVIMIHVSTGCVWVLLTRSCALLISMLTRVVTTAQTLISCILFGIISNGSLIENLQ